MRRGFQKYFMHFSIIYAAIMVLAEFFFILRFGCGMKLEITVTVAFILRLSVNFQALRMRRTMLEVFQNEETTFALPSVFLAIYSACNRCH